MTRQVASAISHFAAAQGDFDQTSLDLVFVCSLFLVGLPPMPPSPQMSRRVYKGIPLKCRGKVWCLLLEVEKVKNAHAGKYKVGRCL